MHEVFMRTLMKDARRGLHSKVGAQSGFPNSYHLRIVRALPGAGPNLSLINNMRSHGDVYNFNLYRLPAVVAMLGF